MMKTIGSKIVAQKRRKKSRVERHGNDNGLTATTRVYDPSLSQRHLGNGLKRQRQTATTTTTLNQALRGPNNWEPLNECNRLPDELPVLLRHPNEFVLVEVFDARASFKLSILSGCRRP